MIFEFTEEERIFRSSIRDIATRLALPNVTGAIQPSHISNSLWQKLGELGSLGIEYPESYGGVNATFTTSMILFEELTKVSSSLAAAVMSHAHLSCYFVNHFGDESLKQRILVPALRGEKIGAFAMIEDRAGSDPANIRTSAKKSDSGWVIKGSKGWVSNGSICDYCVVLANTDRQKGVDGFSFFLVDIGRPGVEVGPRIDTLSNTSLPVCEVFFDDVEVPDNCLLGPGPGGAMQLSADFQCKSRILIAIIAGSIAQTAMKNACAFARDREAFGRPVSDFQLIRAKFAQHWMNHLSARLLAYQIGRQIDRGEICSAESTMAKIMAAEVCQRAVDEAGRIYGGNSVAMEFPQQQFLRDARFLLFATGCHEVLLDQIGKLYVEREGNVEF